ncbi:hypothetical protein GCM10010289_09980 [Streptomyces violascens]|uniref:Uncharacterized protein n=1 Tax=Streptomyces violascens TaxID=67381 RepID=A0ABQ3QHB5_9ACTN|nr:hypothetical protein GCM10010289_09980 [Streptomyces violascens]GHI36663.1 hypothetical protein Sviol_10710 [Streptomyces violascens]
MGGLKVVRGCGAVNAPAIAARWAAPGCRAPAPDAPPPPAPHAAKNSVPSPRSPPYTRSACRQQGVALCCRADQCTRVHERTSEEKGSRVMCKHHTAAFAPPSRYDVILVSRIAR